jgi:zinc D-Ala-D-Ala carboxypeptidase
MKGFGWLAHFATTNLRAMLAKGIRVDLGLAWTGYKRMAKYFTDEEVRGLNPKLVEMLDKARKAAGVPFIITSGYRSPRQNQSAGGAKDSAHEYGLAVDLRAPNDGYGKQVAFGLGRAGFIRVGFYDKHCHADIDETKPQVTWTGISH